MNNSENTPTQWSTGKKIAFRITFVFFLLVSIPLSSGWYKNLIAIDWLNPHYRDIYDIARFGTNTPPVLFGGSGRPNIADGEGQEAASPQKQRRSDSLTRAKGAESSKIDSDKERSQRNESNVQRKEAGLATTVHGEMHWL
ncbi:hypothetical protein [Pedobacter panaciterrae]